MPSSPPSPPLQLNKAKEAVVAKTATEKEALAMQARAEREALTAELTRRHEAALEGVETRRRDLEAQLQRAARSTAMYSPSEHAALRRQLDEAHALHRTAALARAMGLTGPDERGIVIDTDNMLLGDASVELVGTVAVSRARPKFKCL